MRTEVDDHVALFRGGREVIADVDGAADIDVHGLRRVDQRVTHAAFRAIDENAEGHGVLVERREDRVEELRVFGAHVTER